MFNGFSEFLTPFTLGDHNFLISNLFLTILSVLDAQRGGLQVLFGHQKQKSLPLADIFQYINYIYCATKLVHEVCNRILASNCIWFSI